MFKNLNVSEVVTSTAFIVFVVVFAILAIYFVAFIETAPPSSAPSSTQQIQMQPRGESVYENVANVQRLQDAAGATTLQPAASLN